MEFKINSKQFEKILTKVYPAVPSKTPMAILQNFMIDITDGLLTVYATDMEMAIKATMNIVAEKNMQFVVPAKLLYETIRELPDTIITFSLGENYHLKLTTDRGVYNLSYIETKDYPEIPKVSNETEFILSAQDLSRAINKTSFAASDEDMRLSMTGILFDFAEDGLRFVATDGHKLVKYINKSIKTNLLDQFIVPKKAGQILSKVLSEDEVKINFTKSHASFHFPDFELVTRLIADKYPNYNSVIPLENEILLTVKREDLISAIRRMMVFATENNKQVKLSITGSPSGSELKILAENIDTSSSASETLDCEFNDNSMVIGFNVFYLNDMITHIDSEKIIFKLNSPTKACLIEPSEPLENEEIVMLLMPVRLNN